MNSKEFIDGLLANYPENLHPKAEAQRDMLRILFGLGFAPDQLQSLYDDTLRCCRYFPLVADIMACVERLGFVSQRNKTTALQATQHLLTGLQDHSAGALTFREWLDGAGGGRAEIAEQCGHDPEKIRKRMELMNVFDDRTGIRLIADYDDSIQIEPTGEPKEDWDTI